MIKKIQLERYHYVALVGWIAKIFTVMFSFASTRLLLDLIGIEGFALFAVINSFLAWIVLLNFGIPSGVQNLIAKYIVDEKDLSELFSVLSFVVLVFILFFIPIIIIFSFLINDYFFTMYQDILTVKTIIIVMTLFFFFGLSQIFYKILFAIDKGVLPNIYPLLISFFGFLSLLVLRYFEIVNLNIILPIFFLSYLIIFIISYIQSIGLKIPKYNKDITLELFRNSRHFFIIAVLGTGTLGLDYMIMVKLVSTNEITQYSLSMKVFSLILFMYSTLLASSWTLISRAYHMNNYQTIRSIIKKNLIVGFFLVFIFTILIIYFRDNIFFLLTGEKNLILSYYLIIFSGIYILIRIWTDTYAHALSAIGQTNILIFIIPFQALASIFGQYYFTNMYGVNGIIIGLSLSYVCTVSIMLPIVLNKKLRNKI